MNYFAAAFEKMETRNIQDFLRVAQINLPESKGALREVYKEGIRGAAAELLNRYREQVRS